MVKLLANLLHASAGERTKFEKLSDTRQKQVGKTLWQYARGKASPFASFGLDAATAQDYSGRPIGFLPHSEKLSRKKMLQGQTPFGPGEYALETFSPIPVEEAVKEAFKSEGMDESTATRLLKTLTIVGGMGLTGARVSEDVQ